MLSSRFRVFPLSTLSHPIRSCFVFTQQVSCLRFSASTATPTNETSIMKMEIACLKESLKEVSKQQTEIIKQINAVAAAVEKTRPQPLDCPERFNAALLNAYSPYAINLIFAQVASSLNKVSWYRLLDEASIVALIHALPFATKTSSIGFSALKQVASIDKNAFESVFIESVDDIIDVVIRNARSDAEVGAVAEAIRDIVDGKPRRCRALLNASRCREMIEVLISRTTRSEAAYSVAYFIVILKNYNKEKFLAVFGDSKFNAHMKFLQSVEEDVHRQYNWEESIISSIDWHLQKKRWFFPF